MFFADTLFSLVVLVITALMLAGFFIKLLSNFSILAVERVAVTQAVTVNSHNSTSSYMHSNSFVCLFDCLIGFVTCSLTNRLYRGRAPRQSV